MGAAATALRASASAASLQNQNQNRAENEAVELESGVMNWKDAREESTVRTSRAASPRLVSARSSRWSIGNA